MPVLLSVAGVVLLAVAIWSRLGRSAAARWWIGDRVQEYAVLCWLPGFALILSAAGPLSTYDGVDRTVLGLVPLVIVGGLLSLWGGLFLPIPRWYTPRWTRTGDTTLLANRVLGMRNRRKPR